jgi:predicted PurR-regulated permease PerM
MVAVSQSSVKYITEHDILKFVGALASALLVPLVAWLFISLSSKLTALDDHIRNLDVQVAVLQEKLRKHSETVAAEFDATKSQIRSHNLIVQGVRSDTTDLINAVNTKVVKPKRK